MADAVGTGSPAADAGVQAGDRVVGRNLPSAIRALDGAAGATVALTIERAGVQRDVRLALRPYL